MGLQERVDNVGVRICEMFGHDGNISSDSTNQLGFRSIAFNLTNFPHENGNVYRALI